MAPDKSVLSNEELARYSRHLILPQVGEEGQLRLKRARVLVVGAGGLGSPVAMYLAAAGIGTIGIVDFDEVDVTNLHRQIMHGSADVGRPKIESAVARLRDLNPNTAVEPYRDRLTSANALEIAGRYDLIVDGTDNFATRYLINDAAILLGIPNVYGSIHRFEGQASVFGAKNGPCYRCLFREPPPPDLVPNCAEAGVLGVLPGLIGTIQATEAIKMILNLGEPLVGRLLLVDAATMTFRTIAIRKDPECPACGTREIRELRDYDAYCGTADPMAQSESEVEEISAGELERRLRERSIDLIDVREPHEWRTGFIPGARLVPLRAIPDEISRLDPSRETVFYCRMGSRSMNAAEHAAQAGMRRVSSLAGGILGWMKEVKTPLARD